MMKQNIAAMLREAGIQPSAQRMAVAQYVLSTDQHPCADEVWAKVMKNFPMISRATVYNTLNLLVRKKLLRELFLSEGKVVFDPNMDVHHHFIDTSTGKIHDIPWDKVQVCNVQDLPGVEIEDYQVVIRGRKRKNQTRS